MDSAIFLSYRHEDANVVRALQVALEAHMSKAVVVRDLESFQGGEDLRQTITEHLQASEVVLVVIGPSWMDNDAKTGQHRLNVTNDWVRFEVSLALAWGKTIIPLLIDDTTMPLRYDLPTDIAEFADRVALRLRDADWNTDIAALLERITPGWQQGEQSAPRIVATDTGPVAGGNIVLTGDAVAGRDLSLRQRAEENGRQGRKKGS